MFLHQAESVEWLLKVQANSNIMLIVRYQDKTKVIIGSILERVGAPRLRFQSARQRMMRRGYYLCVAMKEKLTFVRFWNTGHGLTVAEALARRSS